MNENNLQIDRQTKILLLSVLKQGFFSPENIQELTKTFQQSQQFTGFWFLPDNEGRAKLIEQTFKS